MAGAAVSDTGYVLKLANAVSAATPNSRSIETHAFHVDELPTSPSMLMMFHIMSMEL